MNEAALDEADDVHDDIKVIKEIFQEMSEIVD
jgi:hypothetical protein